MLLCLKLLVQIKLNLTKSHAKDSSEISINYTPKGWTKLYTIDLTYVHTIILEF